jgi:phospholipase/carboxylesterase
MTLARSLLLVSSLLLLQYTSVAAQNIVRGNHNLAGFQYIEAVRGDPANNNLPLLIALHYSSSSPEDVFQYYDSIGVDVRIILPRGNYPKRTGYSWFPKDHYSRDTSTQIETTWHAVDSIAAFIKALSEKYPAKPVVSGVSQGGDISLLLAIRYPYLLKASMPMLGFIHRDAYLALPKASKPIPVHLVHGEADEIVSIDYVRKEVKHLQHLALRVSLASYPGVRHDITFAMERECNKSLRGWLR